MAAAQRTHTGTGNVRIVVTATGMVVMESIDMVVIHIPTPRGIERIVRRIVAPVVGRMPSYPSRSPKPVIDNRAIEIHRLDDIVLAIYIRIAHYLYGHGLILFALHIDGSHVLINVFCQHGLQHNQAVLPFAHLNDAKVVHIAIAVQVKVIQVAFLRIKFLLKLLKVIHFAEQSRYGTKVEALRDVLISSRNGNRLIGSG